jgi:hypothetical protein
MKYGTNLGRFDRFVTKVAKIPLERFNSLPTKNNQIDTT